MKNEFTPKPGWLVEDVERAQGVYRPADEIAKQFGCPRDPRFGCSECGADWMDACRRRASGDFRPDAHCVAREAAEQSRIIAEQKAVINQSVDDMVAIAQCAEAAEAADASEICAAILELRQQRDAARFEASRARGEAHTLELALKELRKKRNAECRALGRVLMIARDVLEPKSDDAVRP